MGNYAYSICIPIKHGSHFIPHRKYADLVATNRHNRPEIGWNIVSRPGSKFQLNS